MNEVIMDNSKIIKEIEELKEASKMYREKIDRGCIDKERQMLYPWCDFEEKAKDCDRKVSILSELLLLRSGKAEIIKEFGNELISYFSDWQLSTAAFIVRDRNPEQEKEYTMIEESIKAIREFTDQKVKKCLGNSEK